jgi:hypothetical protein
MASACFPIQAMALRGVAVVWFFAFGVAKVLLDLKSASARKREAAANQAAREFDDRFLGSRRS